MARQQAEHQPVKGTSPAQCCGGPAPAGIDACCVRDAEAKAAGKGGCGCSSPAPASTEDGEQTAPVTRSAGR